MPLKCRTDRRSMEGQSSASVAFGIGRCGVLHEQEALTVPLAKLQRLTWLTKGQVVEHQLSYTPPTRSLALLYCTHLRRPSSSAAVSASFVVFISPK